MLMGGAINGLDQNMSAAGTRSRSTRLHIHTLACNRLGQIRLQLWDTAGQVGRRSR